MNSSYRLANCNWAAVRDLGFDNESGCHTSAELASSSIYPALYSKKGKLSVLLILKPDTSVSSFEQYKHIFPVKTHEDFDYSPLVIVTYVSGGGRRVQLQYAEPNNIPDLLLGDLRLISRTDFVGDADHTIPYNLPNNGERFFDAESPNTAVVFPEELPQEVMDLLDGRLNAITKVPLDHALLKPWKEKDNAREILETFIRKNDVDDSLSPEEYYRLYRILFNSK